MYSESDSTLTTTWSCVNDSEAPGRAHLDLGRGRKDCERLLRGDFVSCASGFFVLADTRGTKIGVLKAKENMAWRRWPMLGGKDDDSPKSRRMATPRRSSATEIKVIAVVLAVLLAKNGCAEDSDIEVNRVVDSILFLTVDSIQEPHPCAFQLLRLLGCIRVSVCRAAVEDAGAKTRDNASKTRSGVVPLNADVSEIPVLRNYSMKHVAYVRVCHKISYLSLALSLSAMSLLLFQDGSLSDIPWTARWQSP